MSTITRTARIACAREHAELVRGIVEVAELAHEPLGVQRPTLAVAGDETERALEARQLLGEVLHLRDLEVMAGNALVVAGAHLAPEREAGLAHASGTTCGRAGEKSSLGPV